MNKTALTGRIQFRTGAKPLFGDPAKVPLILQVEECHTWDMGGDDSMPPSCRKGERTYWRDANSADLSKLNIQAVPTVADIDPLAISFNDLAKAEAHRNWVEPAHRHEDRPEPGQPLDFTFPELTLDHNLPPAGRSDPWGDGR